MLFKKAQLYFNLLFICYSSTLTIREGMEIHPQLWSFVDNGEPFHYLVTTLIYVNPVPLPSLKPAL